MRGSREICRTARGSNDNSLTVMTWRGEITGTPVKEYVDRISASRYSTKPRLAYDAMLAAAERGDVSRILVYHLDRLYRRPRELEPIIDLADRGLIVATVEHGDLDLTTGDGRYNARIVVAGAAKMSDDTSRRVRRAKAQNRERGLQHGGRTPFGWTRRHARVDEPGTTVLEPLHAEVLLLRGAMEHVIRGSSLNDIAGDWSRRGVRGHAWNGTDVRRVLSLPRHVALVPVNDGEWMRDATGAEVKAQWPAIVPRQLWDDCRAVIASRATGVGIPRRRSLLTGRLTCGACGAPMTHSQSGVHSRPIWRCWGGRRGGCGSVSIGAAPVEAVILDELFRYVDGNKLRRAMRQSTDRSRAADAVRRDLAALTRKSAELVDAFADRGGSGNAYRLATDKLDERRRQLDAQLGALIERSPLESVQGELKHAWPDFSVDEQRAILAEVYPRIVIQPAKSRGCRFNASRVVLG